jgi:hypothetical protein
MTNKEQNNIPCLSIAQMGMLQELGVDTSNATFAWVVDISGIVAPIYTLKKDVDNYTDINSVVLPAFGIMDILSLLPIKLKWEGYSSGCGVTSELGDFSFSLKGTSEISIEDHFKMTRVLHNAFIHIVAGERPLDVAFYVLEEFAEKKLISKTNQQNNDEIQE